MLIPFLTFRIMVGCGLIMLGLALARLLADLRIAFERNRSLLWCIFLSFPLPFIATLAGWYTAEVGRQPWVVYGVLRTAEAMTPFLTTHAASISLILFCAVYTFIFSFGTFYIYRLLRAGPAGVSRDSRPRPSQPADVARPRADTRAPLRWRRRIAMVMFWVRFWPSASCSTCCSTASISASACCSV